MLNALKYIKRLESVGFPREQTEAHVQLVIFQSSVKWASSAAGEPDELSRNRIALHFLQRDSYF